MKDFSFEINFHGILLAVEGSYIPEKQSIITDDPSTSSPPEGLEITYLDVFFQNICINEDIVDWSEIEDFVYKKIVNNN